MPADTANKRHSAMELGESWRGVLPLPDGTVDAADRATLLDLYAMGAAAPPPGGGNWPQGLRRTLMAHDLLRIARPEWFGPDEDLYRLRR